MKIEIKILDKDTYNQSLPAYATDGSGAVDLKSTQDIILLPKQIVTISTGISIHLGSHDDIALRGYRQYWDYVGLLLPRSSLGCQGLCLANTIGLIDNDYQGEILIKAQNSNPNNSIVIKKGMRIAQLLITITAKVHEWNIVKEFTQTTTRNINGFGSTGE